MSLKVRWTELLEKVERCRQGQSVKVIAVSKLQSEDVIREAYDLGIRSFGENYAQELARKTLSLKDLSIDWHFIGQLQSKKIKDLVSEVSFFHSVTSEKHLLKLEEQAFQQKCKPSFLLQVNLSGEASKGGVAPSEVESFLARVKSLKSVSMRGFMTMPPLQKDPADNQRYFAQLKDLQVRWQGQFSDDFHKISELSMGTSSDFEYAVKEGATMIRVGTSLLGPRK